MNSNANAKQSSIKQILRFAFTLTTSEIIERVNSTLIDIYSQESDNTCIVMYASLHACMHDNANASHIAHQTIQKEWSHLPLLGLVAT